MTQQLGLFSAGDPAFPRDLSGLRWTDLDEGAWVAFAPGLMSGHDALYRALVDDTSWRSGRRQMYDAEVDIPRLMARFPEDGPAHPAIFALRDALSRHFGRCLRQLSANWYRDGTDSVAPHSDKLGELKSDTVVAILSLGEPRPFVLRPKSGGKSAAKSRRYLLGWGDLLVMGGDCQDRWEHGVPKVAGGGGRISVMFRETPPQPPVLGPVVTQPV